MSTPLRFVFVTAADATSWMRALQQGGYAPLAKPVASGAALAEELGRHRADVVIADPAVVPLDELLSLVRTEAIPLVLVADDPVRLQTPAIVVGKRDVVLLGAAVSHALRRASSPTDGVEDPVPSATEEAVISTRASSPGEHALSVPGSVESGARAVRAIAEHLLVGLYQSTPGGHILYANPALASILGVDTVEELEGLHVHDDLGYPRAEFAQQFQHEGAVRNLIIQWTDRRGRTKYTCENARAVTDADGHVLYYEGTMEDVTVEHTRRAQEQRQTERLAAFARFASAVDEAKSVEEVYRAAVEAIEASLRAPYVILVARQGDQAVCGAANAAVGAELVEYLNGYGFSSLMPAHGKPVLLPDVRANRPPWLTEESLAVMEAHTLRAVGCFPLVYHGTTHGAFLVAYPDVHTFSGEELHVAKTLSLHIAGSLARQQAESSLRDSEACLRFIAENTAHVVYRLRYETDAFDYLSPAVRDLTGYTAEELVERGGLSRLVLEREVLEGAGLMDGPPAPGGSHHYLAVYKMQTRTGGTRWVENNAYPWYDGTGQAVGLVGVLQDVTERKRRDVEQAAEAARRYAHQKVLVELARLPSLSPPEVARYAAEWAMPHLQADRVGVWVVDRAAATLTCLDVFEAAHRMHITEPAVSLGTVEALLAELEKSRAITIGDVDCDERIGPVIDGAYLAARGVRSLVQAPIRRGSHVVGIVAFHNTQGPCTWSATELEFAAGLADGIALAFERHEREGVEAARRESEQRNRAISELATDYAFALSVKVEGTLAIDWATEAFTRVTGYAARDLDGLDGLRAIIHPESQAVVEDAFATLSESGYVDLELRIVTRQGEERWVYHRAQRIEDPVTGDLVFYNSGQDVTERKRFERELIAAREEAEEMARLKSAFLANMSHEIRTPLTGILGYADLLGEEGEGEHRDFVQLIERSGRRLMDTLNSVLDLARLEASGIDPLLEVLNVGGEAEQAIEMLRPLAEQKGLRLELKKPPCAVWARLDRACFARILTNLIGNAIKFTETGYVRLELVPEGDDLSLYVRDSGIGIDPAFVPHLFDEFRQETSGQERSHEGAGLGLSITKRLVELQGGRIAVESRRPGGSTFIVTVPRVSKPGVGEGSGADASPPEHTLGVPAPSSTMIIRPTQSREAPDGFPPMDVSSSAFTSDCAALDIEDLGVVGYDDAESESFSALVERGEQDVDEAIVTSVDAPAFTDEPYDSNGREDCVIAESTSLARLHPHELLSLDALLGFGEADSVRADGPARSPAAQEPVDDPPEWLEALPPSSDYRWEPLDPVHAEHTEPIDAKDFGLGREQPIPASGPAVLPSSPAMLNELLTSKPAAPASGEGASADEQVTVPPPSEESPERPGVLVVEDNDDTRLLLERLLQRSYRVCAVRDARSALNAMNEEHFDALVLDINLGGKQTGVDVLKVARTLPGYGAVYAIALTAYALPGDRERFIEAGFDRYVSKPFTRTTLMEALTAGIPAPNGKP